MLSIQVLVKLSSVRPNDWSRLADLWSLTPGTLLLETIRASDCGRPRRVVAQTSGRPRQVLLYWQDITRIKG